jgi:hypothetical protein
MTPPYVVLVTGSSKGEPVPHVMKVQHVVQVAAACSAESGVSVLLGVTHTPFLHVTDFTAAAPVSPSQAWAAPWQRSF